MVSRILGSPGLGEALVQRADIFTNLAMRGGISRKLSLDEQLMHRRPHPTPESRLPLYVLPREILGAQYLLADVERELPTVANKPALLVWAHKDQAFKDRHRGRWEQTFPNHRTVILRNASHYIQEDAPDEIVAAIVDWWPTTRGTAAPGNQS